MNKMKQHWENIFQTKSDQQKSWYQSYPSISIELIEELHPGKNAAIVDIGGGDSLLVDSLLDKGYTNITVLDISASAIENSKKRLGDKSHQVKWVTSDILDFHGHEQFNVWHDRAAFHFLTTDAEIENYVETCRTLIAPSGYLILGTFSESGPQKCSGLDVKRYSESSMTVRFAQGFDRIRCVEENHVTPTKAKQDFLFCVFKKQDR